MDGDAFGRAVDSVEELDCAFVTLIVVVSRPFVLLGLVGVAPADGIFWTTLSWRKTKDSVGAPVSPVPRRGCFPNARGDKFGFADDVVCVCARRHVFLTFSGAGRLSSFSFSDDCRAFTGGRDEEMRSNDERVRSAREWSSCSGCLHFWHTSSVDMVVVV